MRRAFAAIQFARPWAFPTIDASKIPARRSGAEISPNFAGRNGAMKLNAENPATEAESPTAKIRVHFHGVSMLWKLNAML
jgi:hypothetical protein